jgi:two-component system phosphate regulon sensor histidine kinase PhoR
MNNKFFKLLVFLMSLSLIGIILVQLYLINTSFKNNDEQFKYHVQQVIDKVADDIKQQETFSFLRQYNILKDSIGKEPKKRDLLEYVLVQKNRITNETIIYSNSIISEDYKVNLSFFDKKRDSITAKNLVSKRKTEIYSGNQIDNDQFKSTRKPDISYNKQGSVALLDKANFEIFFRDIIENKSLAERIPKEKLQRLLDFELNKAQVKTPYEFAVNSNGFATKLKSDNFNFDKKDTYSVPILTDIDGVSKYRLLVSFPEKRKFLFSELIGITTLSTIFTLIIIIAYSSALSQLIKQRQISEIKTDFINNMTHEFKTPIATINLALDAIKNPKIIDNKDKVFQYLQMIRDENKRMHAQVENVLRISKLEKKELEIEKEAVDINEIIEVAIDHVNLILEDRGGTIDLHLDATRTTVLLNDVHFTNVIVNILDNAIKYSPENPVIDIYTENLKDLLFIKIKDQGAGLSKSATTKIFEKFYREHTGDLHNVKGHGLGLAYVKRIVEDHNGQITVESEKGKGSTFIIKLPIIN